MYYDSKFYPKGVGNPGRPSHAILFKSVPKTYKTITPELKKELKKVKDYFNGLKEQYKVPLESSDTFVPDSEKESYESFKMRLGAHVIIKENGIS